MNNNINKLIDKAGLGQLQHIGGGDWDNVPTPQEIKLVELVVKECINIVQRNRANQPLTGFDNSSDAAVENIKQYFGLK
jgi:hypothetical protein